MLLLGRDLTQLMMSLVLLCSLTMMSTMLNTIHYSHYHNCSVVCSHKEVKDSKTNKESQTVIVMKITTRPHGQHPE